MNDFKHRSWLLGRLPIVGLCLLVLSNAGVSGGRTQAAPQTPVPQPQKRAPYSLEMLVNQANWDVTQRGPLLALDPVLVYRNANIVLPPPGPSGYDMRLAAPGFDRMLVNTGTISILAPTQMTLIEDNPHERPNLYDGLPRDLKVKYLMSTLTTQQWKTLGERGLGMGDLTGEQQPVYLSLLPNPFVLNRWTLDANGVPVDRSSPITLTPEQRTQIRLRIHRNAQVSAPLQNNSRVHLAIADVDEPPGPPNGVKWERNTRLDEQKTDLFGVNLSSVVPNKLKPSQLDYTSSRLNAPVALEGAATLGDMIARISATTHLEIYADGRVARIPLMVRGSRARSGDVLKALALAVTGTYRKVDTAFVLTSDLTGIGTRQMRLAEWQWQIKAQTELLEKELIKQILQHSGKSGGVLALGYAPNDPYALTPALEQEVMKHNDIPAEKLTPALQQLLHEAAAQHEKQNPSGDKMRDDTASFDIHWRFAFQLSDGAILPQEGYVGSTWQYYPFQEEGQAANGVGVAADLKPFARHPLPDWVHPRTLFLTPRTPQDAIEMAQTARRLGFTELVLRTEDKATLKATIAEAGKQQKGIAHGQQTLHVCAAIAPFGVPTNEAVEANSLDVNLMGDTAAQVVAARAAQPRWNKFLQRTVTSAGPRLVPERIGGVPNALAPVGPNSEARFRRIAELARTEGLAGLFLYDTQPGGYAGKRTQSISTNDQVLSERENLGYSSALRLAFLRKASTDPLDLTPPYISVDVDLLLPFFPDKVAASHSVVGDWQSNFTPEKQDQWDVYRAETNRKAMADLFALLRAANPTLPLMIESRAALNNVADWERLWPAWASWTQPENLLVGTSLLHDSAKRPPPAPGERYLFPVQFSASELLPAHAQLREEMEFIQRITRPERGDYPLALDLAYLPATRALALLNEFIAPVPQATTNATAR